MENVSHLVPWDVTFSLWTRTRVQDRLVLASDGDYQFSPYLFTEDALNAFQAGGQIYTATNSIEVTDEWHHFVSIVDRTNSEIIWYYDGEFVEKITMSDDYNGNPTFGPDTVNNAIIFGRFARWSDDGNYLLRMWPFGGIYGHLDEISLWAQVLSATDVAQVYSNGLDAKQIRVQPSTLVLCYSFDDDIQTSTTVKNIGIAGESMDAVLGAYATRVAKDNELTDVWQDETDEGCDTFISCTVPIRISDDDDHHISGSNNHQPLVEDQDVTVVESDELTFYLYSYDEDGDWVDYKITTFPEHGELYEIESFTRDQYQIQQQDIPYSMQFVHFRLLYYPAIGRDDKASIGFIATDIWNKSSEEAFVNIEVIQVDNTPETNNALFNATEDDAVIHIQLMAIDVDSDYLQTLITSVPKHGSLYSSSSLDASSKIDMAFAPWTIYEPIDQYVIDVIDVSSYWVSPSNDEYDYPYWHPFMVLGEQSVDVYGDSRLAWSPLNRAAPDGIYQDGDDLISFGPWNPRENLEKYGYSEFIEVVFETPVYVQEIIIGMPRGMGAVVTVKAWDNTTTGYQTLFSDEADADYERYMQLTNQYSYFAPYPLCETAFLTNRIRIEMDTLTVSDWNEIDYVMLRGSLKKQSSRLQCFDGIVDLWYVPDPNYFGIDSFEYKACDCGSDSCSDETTIKIDVAPVQDAPIVSELSNIELSACVVGEKYDLELPASDADSKLEPFIYVLEGIVNASSDTAISQDFAIYDGDIPITSFPYRTQATINSTLKFGRLSTTMGKAAIAYYVEDSTGLRSTTGTAIVKCHEETCGIGSYFDGTKCTSCPPGSYSDIIGMRFTCKLCEPGTYQSESGLNSCLSCGSTEIATSEEGATECTCLEGSYLEDSVCQICGPGTYSDTINAESCQKCPPGWYTSNDHENDGSGVSFAASTCLPCPADSYSNDTTSALCMPCPDRLTSDEGSTSCDKCVELYYYDDRDGSCQQCKDVVTCNTGTTLATWDLRSGYWRENPSSRDVFECPPVSRCGGGVGLTGENDAICESNFGGRLCAQCQSGYYLSGDNCSECKQSYVTLVRIMLALLLLLICALFLFLSGTPAFIIELYEAQRQARLRRVSKTSGPNSDGHNMQHRDSQKQARRRSSFQAALELVGQHSEEPDPNAGKKLRRLSRSLSDARVAWWGKVDHDDDDDDEDDPAAIVPMSEDDEEDEQRYRTRKRIGGAPPSAELNNGFHYEEPDSPGSPTALLSGKEFEDDLTISRRFSDIRQKSNIMSTKEIELQLTGTSLPPGITSLRRLNTYDKNTESIHDDTTEELSRPNRVSKETGSFSILQDIDESQLDEIDDDDNDDIDTYTNQSVVYPTNNLKSDLSTDKIEKVSDDSEILPPPPPSMVLASGSTAQEETNDDMTDKELNDKNEAEASVALIRLYSMLNVKW
eukprot:CAMPEP_0197314698 /NCGR_PEP_ID=MMETSP0891-20130614/34904_1 /TAXON_ID=44058 ORGANISM="Aureoumbra lagunensis, Strain CCMP1510" /NCGR_SAMPLE_ID=MMETSP0891 /ASSEMBLY_ACC=CAM_ASM_000534 /LENGTH=1427 /DNA_ID=CAMNT_0042803265 /DNA_START=275 /DNA_END=4555 /DNA_ORIENTATION=+